MIGSTCRKKKDKKAPPGTICDLITNFPYLISLLNVQSLVAFPKLKRQVLSYEPPVSSPKDFTDSTLFYVNQEFSLM